MRKKLGRILAWLITIGLLVYLFKNVSPSKIAAAFSSAAPWTIPVLAALVLANYLADSLAIWKTFGWFVVRLSFREVLTVRGATYLLALVNYTVGQGAIVYFVNRSRGVPILRGTAAVLLVMGINVLVLLLWTTVGLAVAPDLPTALRTVVLIAYVGLAVYAALMLIKPRWLTSRPIFDVLVGAGLGGHLRAMLVRIPHITVLLVFSYVSMRAFGVQVPLAQAVVYLPIVYFVAVLPIAVMGLGTTQAVMVHFFSAYVPNASPEAQRATILAASLISQAVAMAVQILVGMICLRSQLGRNLGPNRDTAPASQA